MKKLLIATAFLFAGYGIASADFPTTVDGFNYPPKAVAFVTEAVFITSITCSNNASNNAPIKIATSPAQVYIVDISSPGQAGSMVQLFDAQITTTNVRPLTPPIVGSTVMPHPYNVYAASGVTISNFGPASAACVGVSYRFR